MEQKKGVDNANIDNVKGALVVRPLHVTHADLIILHGLLLQKKKEIKRFT